MRRHLLAIACVLSAGLVGSASATTYTSSASFLPNVAAGSYFNNFSTVSAGASTALSFSNGTYAYTVDSNPISDGLYNDTGIISTDLSGDAILVTFTGAPVTAVGGNFWSTDINVSAVPSTVTLTLSNGTIESFSSSASTDYRGFTSGVAITSLLIDAGNTGVSSPAWPTLDNLTVGAAAVTPEPASLSALVGLTALARRRRA